MTLDTDLATLREQLRHLGPWRGAVGDEALDRVETELARLRKERDDFKRKWRAQPTTDWAKLALLEAKEAAEREFARLRQEKWAERGIMLDLQHRAETTERELARLQDGLRLTHAFVRERIEDGHPGLLDMHLVEDKLRALLADTPDHAPPHPR